ncbi:MAG: hypothetical protein DWC10_05455 [Candidatus Poseidoniales archaeon]|nr:MAG: hypothetical protein DWC10_05455 [Candidatus Poseidoniales archaeon]
MVRICLRPSLLAVAGRKPTESSVLNKAKYGDAEVSLSVASCEALMARNARACRTVLPFS